MCPGSGGAGGALNHRREGTQCDTIFIMLKNKQNAREEGLTPSL